VDPNDLYLHQPELPSLLLVAVAANAQFENCKPSEYIVNTTTAAMSPYPVEPGKNVTITTFGDQETTMTGGTWNTSVYLGPVKVEELSGPLCDGSIALLFQGCGCPCPPDANRESIMTQFVKKDAPPGGTLTSITKSYNPQGKQTFCLKVTFEIAK